VLTSVKSELNHSTLEWYVGLTVCHTMPDIRCRHRCIIYYKLHLLILISNTNFGSTSRFYIATTLTSANSAACQVVIFSLSTALSLWHKSFLQQALFLPLSKPPTCNRVWPKTWRSPTHQFTLNAGTAAWPNRYCDPILAMFDGWVMIPHTVH